MTNINQHDKIPLPPLPPLSTSYIGTAYMDEEGTIELRLRTDDEGLIGHGLLRYPKSHPDYMNILSHLNGLSLSEYKSVKPWPALESVEE